MKVFFWDYQDDNDIARQWSMFLLNLAVLCFTAVALLLTWRHYRRCMFEMMPLSINAGATLVLLMLKLFEKGYEFDYIGHLIEIFTYFLFCYTFAIMYTIISDPQLRRRVRIIWNIVLACVFVLLVVLSALVFAGKISKKCRKENEELPAIIALVFESLSFAPTVFYGLRILSRMGKKEQLNNADDESESSSFTSEVYIRERRKQIKMVLVTYSISIVIRMVSSMVTIFMWKQLFTCSRIEGVSIITSDSAIGQFMLVVAEINELLPHVVIPVAMYVVPLRKMGRAKTISLDQGLLDEDDNEEHHKQELNIENRVSSLLTSRLSEDASPRSTPRKRLAMKSVYEEN